MFLRIHTALHSTHMELTIRRVTFISLSLYIHVYMRTYTHVRAYVRIRVPEHMTWATNEL